jgi:hypothetical protein
VDFSVGIGLGSGFGSGLAGTSRHCRRRAFHGHAAVTLKTGQKRQHSVVPFLNTRLLRAADGCDIRSINALRIVKQNTRYTVVSLLVGVFA